MQFLFGTGVFWGTPLTDANGAAIANPTPIQLGVMQDFSLDISFETKELYGQSQFPVAVGRGKGKMTGKSKTAQMNGTALNSLFFGQTVTAGQTDTFYDVSGQVITTVTGVTTVTPVPPNSGVFSYGLGVRDANGLPMTRVTSSPTAGQYSLDNSTGVYTFATADAGNVVFISYQYTVSGTGVTSTIKNVIMGAAPTFQGDLYIPYAGKSLVITIPRCISSKWSLATKLDDFIIPEFDFSGFADEAGNALYWSLSDK